MPDWLLLAVVLLLWILLNRWILPWFGIPTCMSCGCGSQQGSACPTPRGAERPRETGQIRPDASGDDSSRPKASSL